MQLPRPEEAFLIGKLLEVNQSTGGWNRFIQAFLEHFDLRSVHLYIINRKTQAMRFHIDAGEPVSAEYMGIYVDKYIHQDHLMNAVLDNPTGCFYASNLLPQRYAVYENDHYQYWAKPQGIIEGCVACLFQEDGWDCFMASNRNLSQGPYGEDEIERMNAILPFIERALRASFTLNDLSISEQRAKAIVRTFRIPVAVLTEFGDLWALNDPMTHYIENSHHLSIESNSLRLSNLKDDKDLNVGILQASKKANGIDLAIEDARRIQISSNATLGFTELYTDTSEQAQFLGIMVFIISKDGKSAVSEDILKSLFKLTQSEARVAYWLHTGLAIKEIASKENKSVYTVREQLNNVLKKTGCTNQVSLINLVATIPI